MRHAIWLAVSLSVSCSSYVPTLPERPFIEVCAIAENGVYCSNGEPGSDEFISTKQSKNMVALKPSEMKKLMDHVISLESEIRKARSP